jgi:hypothetical protein
MKIPEGLLPDDDKRKSAIDNIIKKKKNVLKIYIKKHEK